MYSESKAQKMVCQLLANLVAEDGAAITGIRVKRFKVAPILHRERRESKGKTEGEQERINKGRKKNGTKREKEVCKKKQDIG